MKNFRAWRRLLGWAALLALLTTTVVPVHAETKIPFTDVKNHWALTYIAWAVEHGLVEGAGDGKFRPNDDVTEAQFLAMLLRAYPETGVRPAGAGEKWYAPYYRYAESAGWPVRVADASVPLRRGEVAVLSAAINGQTLGETAAVQWMLDEGLSKGKTAATVAGFAPQDRLTRAEALTFLYQLKRYMPELVEDGDSVKLSQIALRGIRLGDSAASVTASLGSPTRIDPSRYGMQWHVYAQDYANFAMIGIRDGKVAGLFSNAKGVWTSAAGFNAGIGMADALRKLKQPASARVDEREAFVPIADDQARGSLFVDQLDRNRVVGLLVLAASTPSAIDVPASAAEQQRLASAYEREIFDLANAERVRRGLSALRWNDTVADVARGHSQDMIARDFFDHVNPDGDSPFDRMEARELNDYSYAAENIAAGQDDAMMAYLAWLNSKTGHREALLSEKAKLLGVGVAFGGEYRIYYTQNFFTPFD